ISDVTDSFVALAPELVTREAVLSGSWLEKEAHDRLSAAIRAGGSEENPTPNYVRARDEARRARFTSLWFRSEPVPVVVLDPVPGDVEVRTAATDIHGDLMQ